MPRYAAIDVGSNSIRMLTAETGGGSPPRILAEDREVTRLGESVFRSGRLNEEAMQLACSVLARMAAKCRSLDVAGARAVATASVRDARNQAEFLERASAAAGLPVEVISGQEEARLIHLGVLSRWPGAGSSILMVDIGGGSAEIIASQNGHVRDAVSKPIGAIRLREIFLRNDPPDESELREMREYVEGRLDAAVEKLGHGPFTRAIGTSATAAAAICAANGIPRARRDEADRRRAATAEVRRLYKRITALNLAGRRKVTGIGPRRAEIIIPGVCVLLTVLEKFGLPSVYYSAAGVRDGIVADLETRGVGRELLRLRPDERRDVERLSRRFGVPREHGRAVAAFAVTLFESLQPLHGLPAPYGRLLEAAAHLHDVGHYISDASHHKHSYYVIANSDMPGFTAGERLLIANLCRYHRKALPSNDHENLEPLAPAERNALARLIPLLRAADALDRSGTQRIKSIDCALRNGEVLMNLRSSEDIALEKWAVERVGSLFEDTYRRRITLRQAPK